MYILEIFFRYADGREIKEEDYAYLIDSSYSARGDNIDSYIGTSPDENIFQRKYSLSNNGQVLRIHNVGMSHTTVRFIIYESQIIFRDFKIRQFEKNRFSAFWNWVSFGKLF